MPRPAGQKTDIEPLGKMEYYLILTHLAAHWRLFYEMLWETGIRIGEGLAVEVMDLTQGSVWVTREKRSAHLREQLPLSPSLYARLIVYAINQPYAHEHEHVRVWPFTQSAGWLALKKAAAAAGVRRTIHPHSFRHSVGYRIMATDFGDKTLDAKLARGAAMLGHKELKTFLRYANPPKGNVREGFNLMNQEENRK